MTDQIAGWPVRGLDVKATMRAGHKPAPFEQFIVKIHSRCNLACTYCYVYEMADQSWRGQPRQMSDDIAQATVGRIAEHAARHHLPEVEVILHGGEPLLAGADWIAGLAEDLHASVQARVNMSVQTNGTRLDQPVLEVLRDLGIRVGVSLDGDAEATGRHRRYASGRNSFDDVADGLHRLGSPEFREIYGGILCTIDVHNDPVATYETLIDFEPPMLDFLLPHGNWSCPPPGEGYADWLIAIFERWYPTPKQETSVRLFQEMIQLVFGGTGAVEGLGLEPSTLIVVDTDGSIKQLDSLSSTYPGAADTGLDVMAGSFDDALAHPTTIARQLGADALPPECQACPVVQICGGGLYPHRYRSGTGFRNPSVYCADLIRLISHVRDRVRGDLDGISTARSPRLAGSAGLRPGPRDARRSASVRTGRVRRRADDPPLRGSPPTPRPWPGWPRPSRCPDGRRPAWSGSWHTLRGPFRRRQPARRGWSDRSRS